MTVRYSGVTGSSCRLIPSLDKIRFYGSARWSSGRSAEEHAPIRQRPLIGLLSTWVLCWILLVLASTYGFSFERGSNNTIAGSKEQGVSAGDSDENVIVHIQNIGTYLICTLLMLPLVHPVGVEFLRNKLVTCLLLWSLISCIWSGNPSTSLINGIRMVLDVALAYFLIRRYSINDLLKLLMLVGSVAAVTSFALILVFPQYGLQSREVIYALGAWEGIFGQKNICGRMMTLLLLPAFFIRIEDNWGKAFRFCYVMGLLITVGMTRSAGSWLLCLGCIGFICTSHFALKLKRKDALSLGVIALSLAATSAVAIASNGDTFLWMIGKDPTMTGRTVLWTSLMDSILKHPFVGYGYVAFWQDLKGESANTILQAGWPGMGYAENGVLELWLELGAVAVLLYAMMFFMAVKDAVYCFWKHPHRGTMWYISILFYVAFTNLWAGNLLSPSNLECILPFIAFAGLRTEARRIRGLQVASL